MPVSEKRRAYMREYYAQNKHKWFGPTRVWPRQDPAKVKATRAARAARMTDEERAKLRARQTESQNRRRLDPEHREKLNTYSRELQYRTKYGMERADGLAMLEAQGGGCKICGAAIRFNQTQKRAKDDAATDHCHATGVVRGILCNPCNLMLGLVNDNPDRLRAAAAYLETCNANDQANRSPSQRRGRPNVEGHRAHAQVAAE